MRVTVEVRKLCLEFRNEKVGSKRWEELKKELTRKWKFTPFNLLALFSSPPVIEYNDENFSLVTEEEVNEPAS